MLGSWLLLISLTLVVCVSYFCFKWSQDCEQDRIVNKASRSTRERYLYPRSPFFVATVLDTIDHRQTTIRKHQEYSVHKNSNVVIRERRTRPHSRPFASTKTRSERTKWMEGEKNGNKLFFFTDRIRRVSERRASCRAEVLACPEPSHPEEPCQVRPSSAAGTRPEVPVQTLVVEEPSFPVEGPRRREPAPGAQVQQTEEPALQ